MRAPLSEVVTGGERELSAEYWLSRAGEFRSAIVNLARSVPGNPNYPFLASPPSSPHGNLSRWDWFVGDDFDSSLLSPLLAAIERGSPLLDLTFAAALQGVELLGDPAGWLVRTNPLVITLGDHPRVRYAVFSWTTDRDAMIEALLGRRVPTTPRYQKTGAAIDSKLEGDLQDARESLGFGVADAVELYGASREYALANAKLLKPVLARLAGGEPSAVQLVHALLSSDAERWADGPLGRLIMPVARAAPRWRTPRVAVEWAAAFDLGVAGVYGFAAWPMDGYEFRKLRRPMAAHLRYLFDYHVAPWNRWPDDRRRREGFLIFWRDRLRDPERPRPSIGDLARAARTNWPEAYRGEDINVTIRRMYRLCASIAPPHK